MEYFAGLDVSMEETAICVIDADGKIVLETAAPTEPEAIAAALKPVARKLKRLGHEAGSLAPWLQPELEKRGLPSVCLETFHVRAALNAQRNKTDRNDALGIAHILRTGWFKKVHIKSEASYRLRLVLTHRRTLKRKFIDIENAIRQTLKTFGIKVGHVSRGKFEARVRELVAGDRLLEGMCECMLRVRATLWLEYTRMHKLLAAITLHDELCRRYLRIPGVGPVTALTFKTTIDDPARFRHSKTVGAYAGLTSRRWQSGSAMDVQGRISRMGDVELRTALVEAAHCLLTRYRGWTTLKAWGMKIQKRKGLNKAAIAVARRLAVIMHAMWRDGSEYRFKEAPGGVDAGVQEAHAAV